MKIADVPVWEKVALTVEEAAKYSNIGINKIYDMMNMPYCDFVLNVGDRKRLIKRKQFERFIENAVQI